MCMGARVAAGQCFVCGALRLCTVLHVCLLYFRTTFVISMHNVNSTRGCIKESSQKSGRRAARAPARPLRAPVDTIDVETNVAPQLRGFRGGYVYYDTFRLRLDSVFGTYLRGSRGGYVY